MQVLGSRSKLAACGARLLSLGWVKNQGSISLQPIALHRKARELQMQEDKAGRVSVFDLEQMFGVNFVWFTIGMLTVSLTPPENEGVTFLLDIPT